MSFSMEVINPEEIKSAIEEQVKPDNEEVSQLKELALNNVSAILDLDIESLEKRKAILQSIDSFGMSTMRVSSEKTPCCMSLSETYQKRAMTAARSPKA